MALAKQIAYSETNTFSVATSDATAIAATSAELHGLINPAGSQAGVWFEWGTSSALGSRSDAQIIAANTAAVPFSQQIKSLQPHTTYYFRAVGYQAAGILNGEIHQFTTSDATSTPTNLAVTTAAATSVVSNSATLHGTVTPGGIATMVWFNWGKTSAMGARTDAQSFNSTSTVTLEQSLKNLEPHTMYYFRIEAYRSSDGTGAAGEVMTFTTGDATTTTSITVRTNDASGVEATAAVLNGTILGGSNTFAGWFEWGTTTSLGQKTDAKLFSGSTEVQLSQQLKNLQSHTTYYFRAVAYPAVAGVPNVLGEIKSFTTTGDTTMPLAVYTNTASAVSSASAELRGYIRTSAAATAWFEWGTSSLSMNKTPEKSFDGSSEPYSYSYSVTNLQPNTTYYFMAVAKNSAGVVRGEPKSFTTSRVPSTAPEKISDVEQGEIRSGYVVITPDNNSAAPVPTVTFGMVRDGSVQSQAGIVPTPMTTDASMFVEIIPSISRSIGVAFANPSDKVNAITLTLRDEDGLVLGSPAIVSVPGHHQVAKFLNELFGGDTIGRGFRGSVRMESATAFAAIGLRFSGPVFSTLPVAISVAASASSTLIIPQFAMSGGWATQIALVNNSGATIMGRVDVFDNAGNPMPVKLNGETRSTFTYSIPVGGTLVLAPRDSNGQSPL